jgi:septal ring factor EnvC (AmiA/AmiB activator)
MPSPSTGGWRRGHAAAALLALLVLAPAGVLSRATSVAPRVTSQGTAPVSPPTVAAPASARVQARIQALQKEAADLAGETRTLVGDLRRLEVERDLQHAKAAEAERAVAAVQVSLDAATARLAALEAQRQAQLPDITAQLVEIYKRGPGGYARMIVAARDLREFARATRAVAALAALDRQRLAEHRRTLAALEGERTALAQQTQHLAARQAEAQRAGTAAQRAVVARAALIDQIDSRRDLTAQYTGDLQVAYDRLQQQVLDAGGRGGAIAVPLPPFRGALDWPLTGPVTGRFGQADRLGGSAVRNGIDIAAPEGTAVRAIHGGTVDFADPFAGFGTLVIVDHGGNSYSLYGYLGSAGVVRGARVEAGSELGRVGTAPGGQPGLYFELRVDGRAVDPIQWLVRQ